MSSLRVGLFPPAVEPPSDGSEHRQAMLARVAEAGIDHLCVADHVSFFVGAGSDGLITATSMLTGQADLPVYVGLYLLPLRHPVLVARQLATIGQLAPGRLTLGVGIGGEDPHEVQVCGVDPKTRGRRMDESLQVLRSLGEGEPVSFNGEFFSLEDALDRTPAITADTAHSRRTFRRRGQPRRQARRRVAWHLGLAPPVRRSPRPDRCPGHPSR